MSSKSEDRQERGAEQDFLQLDIEAEISVIS